MDKVFTYKLVLFEESFSRHTRTLGEFCTYYNLNLVVVETSADRDTHTYAASFEDHKILMRHSIPSNGGDTTEEWVLGYGNTPNAAIENLRSRISSVLIILEGNGIRKPIYTPPLTTGMLESNIQKS